MVAIGDKVRVHKNLHRGDWSVTVNGKVVAHVSEICLSGISFKVRETTRQRVIAKRCRGVHAWIEGTVSSVPRGNWVPITYNPYRAAEFTTREGKPVEACAYVHFTAAGAFACR